MRKLAALFALLVVCGVSAIAQTEPPFEPEPQLAEPSNELFGGFDYEHADLAGSTAVLGIATPSSTGLQGVAFGFSHYFPQLFGGHAGVMLEFSRASNSSVDPTGLEYSRLRGMAGPTVRLRRYGFFTPSIHALAGVDRATFKVPNGAVTISFQDTDVAVAGGGSLDGNLSRHLAVRLAQFDYVYTRHYDVNQSSFRYIGGVVLRF
jgi:hypothetical protein